MLTSYIRVKNGCENLQTLRFVLYSIHSVIRYKNMRSVEHVERMEDMKKPATITIVKPQANTTTEGN